MVKWLIYSILFLPQALLAQVAVVSGTGGNAPDVGTIANNMGEASGVFSGLMADLFYIIGIALVTAAIIQYREHRQNEQNVPLSRCIVLFLAGLFIGFFPFIVNYIGSSTAYYRI